MCAVNWGFVAAWVGALATVGILVAGIYGFGEWRSQFLKTRDHDLARRILNAISDSHLVFDELRTPHSLFSDGDEPVAPETLNDLPGQFVHRQMYARYKARAKHLVTSRQERTAALFEAMALWDDEDYTARLGRLINELAPLEYAVLHEATSHVENLAPGAEDVRVDRAVLFSPIDVAEPDQTNTDYQAIKDNILQHLRPKIRME